MNICNLCKKECGDKKQHLGCMMDLIIKNNPEGCKIITRAMKILEVGFKRKC